MALPGVKPKTIEKRLKLFEFGDAGSRKTMTGLQFPAVYLIDTERGAENDQYQHALEKSGGYYYATDDLDDILAAVSMLLSEEHSYRTLMIDPVTVPYANELDREATRLASEKPGSDGMEFGRHKIGPDRKMKRLLSLIKRLDMNVVLTAHGKTKWRRGPKGEPEEAGTTFDAYAKLDFAMDLMLETQLRGTEAWAIVRKSRIEAFPMLDAFQMSYDAVAERYGRAVLERAAKPVRLASPDLVARLTHLVAVVKLDEEIVEKWLTKADVDSFAEMPEETVLKCIGHIEAKLIGNHTITTTEATIAQQTGE